VFFANTLRKTNERYNFFPEKYLEKGPEVKKLLKYLVDGDKKLFLITNSGFPFV
jgi:hypothetical protein